MSVALLAISSFGTLFMLPSNTVLQEKSLLAITLVVQNLILLFRIMVSVGLGVGRGEVGAQNSVPSAAVPKQHSLAAIRLHGLLFLVQQILFSH